MQARLTRNDVVGRAKALKNTAPLVPLAEIAGQWLLILCGLALFYIYPSWWLYVPLALFIASRQYALAVLLHDAQHSLLHPDKTVNQRLGNWLLGAPLGAKFVDSQKHHLDHHFHFGSKERDPDYALYCFGDPARKQSLFQLARLAGGKLLGEKALNLLRLDADTGSLRPAVAAGSANRPDWRSLPSRLIDFVRERRSIIVVQAILFAAFTLAFGWYGYIALWILPLGTLAALYNDFRIFCEHSLVGRDSSNPEERMVTFISNPIERFFIAPNHMNYHAEHHFFPYVPHRNLPALREAIRQCPEWDDKIEWRASYFGHLSAYIRGFNKSNEELAHPDAREKMDGGSVTHRL